MRQLCGSAILRHCRHVQDCVRLAMQLCDTVGMCKTVSVWPEVWGRASRCVGKNPTRFKAIAHWA
eukprot:10805125-Alexandrium_andersonii.AAC.1